MEDNLVHCTLDHFDKVNADSLRKFVINRHPTLKTATSAKHLKKPRGKALQDAKNGVMNCVLAAYNVRHLKSRVLAKKDEFDAEAQDPPTQPRIETLTPTPHVTRVSWRNERNVVKASTLLNDPQWLNRLSMAFGSDKITWATVDDALTEKADKVQAHLLL